MTTVRFDMKIDIAENGQFVLWKCLKCKKKESRVFIFSEPRKDAVELRGWYEPLMEQHVKSCYTKRK